MLLGIAAIAWGIAGLIAGGNDFTTDAPDGLLITDSFGGFESNGWTNVIWIGGGALLLVGASAHWAAKSMSLLVALGFGAACVIGLIDGNDLFDTVAVNDETKALFGAAAVALVLIALLPRVGGRRDRDVDVVERPAAERPMAERPLTERPLTERPAASEPHESERIGAGGVTRTTEDTDADREAVGVGATTTSREQRRVTPPAATDGNGAGTPAAATRRRGGLLDRFRSRH